MPDKSEKPDKLQIVSAYSLVKRLLLLHMDTIRLTSAEKMSILCSGVALYSIVMMMAMLAAIFFAIGLANLLESLLPPFWTYFIITGLFAIAIVIVFIFKESLIVNPLSRFISKLFVDPPKKQ